VPLVVMPDECQPQEFVAAVVVHDGLADDQAELGRAMPGTRPPWRGEMSAASASGHGLIGSNLKGA
jgi:hypothetical protein